MDANEYLIQFVAGDRLREARDRAAAHHLLEDARASGAAGVGRSTRRRGRRPTRAYWAVASSLISRWRNWRPA
jgi:hypothetical protein